MNYNNELLTQMQVLEERHLLSQRDALEKQGALKQALTVCETARQHVGLVPIPHHALFGYNVPDCLYSPVFSLFAVVVAALRVIPLKLLADGG